MRRVVVFLSYLIIFLAIVFLYLDYQAGKPILSDSESTIFVIEGGDGLKQIAENLEKEKFIKNKNYFIVYTVFRNLRKNFLPGEYQIEEESSTKEIIDILTNPQIRDKTVTFVEGWDNREIARHLSEQGFFSQEEFLERVENVSFFQEKYSFLKDFNKDEKIKSLEGFIFPDTYRLPLKPTTDDVIFRALNNFGRKINNQLLEEIEKQGRDPYQVLVLASIVEKEVFAKEDRQIVAGIFLKRLTAGMALQADSTINYLTGKSDRQARLRDLEIDSLYNTYKYRGLPPGPICNPSLDSIVATIYFQESPYWFFLNAEDETTIFSKTFEEHKKNRIEYLSDSLEDFSLTTTSSNNNFSKVGELLVKYKNDNQIYKIIVDQEVNLYQIRDEYLANNKNIKIIEPNYLYYRSASLPPLSDYQPQWFLERIGAPTAWNVSGGGNEEIVVAVLDSGVDIDHPDLKESIWINKKEISGNGIDNDGNGYIDDTHGWDFVINSNDPRPKIYPTYTMSGIHHGTVVAGLIAAQGKNDQNVIGLSRNIKIMPIRVLDNKGEGTLEAVIRGIDYAVKNKADIINFSFVGPNPSELLFQAIKRAWDENILIVAAAGNNIEKGGLDLDESFLYPICLDANYKENIILGVTATDKSDHKADFANYSNNCVDIAAPGSRVYSTLFYHPRVSGLNNLYGGYWSGTSVATPLVSATAALIKSINPLVSNREIRNIILETTTPIDHLSGNQSYENKLGVGLLNVEKAVNEMQRRMISAPTFQYIVATPRTGSAPLVGIFRPNGVRNNDFFAFDQRYRIGLNIAAGDINGNMVKEIIVGAGQGGGPQVRIFDSNGGLKGQFFAYDQNLRNGIRVAVGDVTGNKKDEIIVGPETGSLPIRVFDYNGRMISEFYAFDQRFTGGVSLAVGDINGNGIKEIIVGAGQGGGPQVRIFDVNGNVKSQFFAFNEKFRGGINIAAGDLNRNGLSEIVVSIASGGSPYVRVFDSSFHLLSQFLAFQRDFYGGVSLAVGDLNGDWQEEIVVAPHQSGGPQIRVFDLAGSVLGQFFAYDRSFNRGLNLAVVQKLD